MKNLEYAKRLLGALGALVDCGTMLLSPGSGKPLSGLIVSEGSCGLDCGLCSRIKLLGGESGCAYALSRAEYSAERFGGTYIYACPTGLMFCVAQAVSEGERLYLLAGPIMAYSDSDYSAAETAKRFGADEAQAEKFAMAAKRACRLKPENVTRLSEILGAIASRLSDGDYGALLTSEEKTAQQREIGEYVQSIKARLILGVDGFSPYPYEKEKLLTYAIMTGNVADSRKYLNEILGHIFFASANNLDAIKVRALELTVLISRAALDGGADMNNIYALNLKFVSEFSKLDSIEDVCYLLTEILRKFSEETFSFANVKHASILTKAITYIRANYMHKITLEDVAEHVYMSPSYLSKIFKEEMQTSFNSYLSGVRIEKSKILLLSQELSLVEISDLVGFFDQSYFNKVFKKLTGVTPKRYREQNIIKNG